MRPVLVLVPLAVAAFVAWLSVEHARTDEVSQETPRRCRPRGSAKPSGDQPSRPLVGPNTILNGITSLNGFNSELVSGALESGRLSNNPEITAVAAVNTQYFSYLIECALPPDARVRITIPGGPTVTFEGALGLTPEWATGPCNEACQEWVTSCMAARVNQFGIPMKIYLTGPNPALIPREPIPETYDVEEGAFYGNMFVEPQRVYACRGSGDDPWALTLRACAHPDGLCGFQYVGPCNPLDGETGLMAARHACEAMDGDQYRRCHNRPSIEGTNEFPVPSKVYDHVIGIRLRRTSFSEGYDAPCVDGPADGGILHPFDSGVAEDAGIRAGIKCWTDDDCASDILSCPLSLRPTCTNGCTDSSTVAEEQAACGGPGTTCLSNALGDTLCTRSCTPGQTETTGGCHPDEVCTGNWFGRQGAPDSPGCQPFCQRDQDCLRNAICNTRLGTCGNTRVNPSRLADGEPCRASGQCRGGCLRTSTTTIDGQCYSLINTAVTPTCGDDPTRLVPVSLGHDDLAVCAYKTCTANGDCTAPLVCKPGPTGADVCMQP